MIKIVQWTLTLIVFVYLVAGAFLYIKQRDLLYFPTPPMRAHGFVTLDIHSEGETIKVVSINPQRDSAILYFGGNGEAVTHHALTFNTLFPDHSVYLVNYRGFGGSTGHPTEQGLYQDALTIYDQIKADHSTIHLVGRSLGSGVATFLASRRQVEKMVLVTPFDSIEKVAQTHYPLFPISLLLLDKYDSLSRVDQIDAQTLIIMAEQDRVIPRKHSEQLAAAFPPEQANVEMIENADHVSISRQPGYHQLLRNFL